MSLQGRAVAMRKKIRIWVMIETAEKISFWMRLQDTFLTRGVVLLL